MLYTHRAIHVCTQGHARQLSLRGSLEMKVHLQVSPLSTWKRTQRAGYSSRGLHTVEPIQALPAMLSGEMAGLDPSTDSHSSPRP